MPNVLHEWSTWSTWYRLCRLRGDEPDEGWRVASPTEALWVLRSATRDPGIMAWLRAASPTLMTARRDDQLVRSLERALADRSLVLLAKARPAVRPGAREPAPAPEKEPMPAERTWIEVQVVDEAGPNRPLAGMRYRLRLPNGSVREGELDKRGTIRVDGIEPGTCWFEMIDPETAL